MVVWATGVVASALIDDLDSALSHELVHFVQHQRDPNIAAGYPVKDDPAFFEKHANHPAELEAFYYEANRFARTRKLPIADVIVNVDEWGTIYYRMARMAMERHPRAVFAIGDDGQPLTAAQFVTDPPKKYAWAVNPFN